MDATSLYREEIYTDRGAGTIRVLVPVTRDGGPDQTRPSVYVGEAQILTNIGPLPISFEIDAVTLGEAAQKYAAAAKEGVETRCASCRRCAVSNHHRSWSPVRLVGCRAACRRSAARARSRCPSGRLSFPGRRRRRRRVQRPRRNREARAEELGRARTLPRDVGGWGTPRGCDGCGWNSRGSP